MPNDPQPPKTVSDTFPFTEDSFLNGRLTVYQHKTGYRFSIDAILLAGFVRSASGDRLIDLGCGCGIISLILAHRHPDLKLFAVEIQPSLADLARKNVAANNLNDRIRILEKNVTTLSQKETRGPVDVVFCNPPFRRIRAGRINPDNEQALARHEIAMTLKDITRTVRRILRTGGRFFIVYPADRLADLFYRMRVDGIEPKRMRIVQSCTTDPAKRVLVEGVAGGRPGLLVEPPLMIYMDDGEYTDEVQEMLR